MTAEPFRIEPTERFLEIRELQKRLAAADGDNTAFAKYWNRIMLLQREISPFPTTPAELLEFATVMLHWNVTMEDLPLDPCEALMRQRKHRDQSYHPEQTAVDLGMAVFALAGFRPVSSLQWNHQRDRHDV
jgi:hypothetical protein